MEAIKLLPYQSEDLKKIALFNDRVLIAWEMGLGKTILSLKRLLQTKAFPALVVCPAGLKLNWQREARRLGIKAHVLYGRVPGREEKAFLRAKVKSDLLIINYDILYHSYEGSKWLGFLKSLSLKTVIGDEIQLISGIRSIRSRTFTYLCKDVEKLYYLSGTPQIHKPFDLFPSISTLWPDTFNSPFSFGFDYCEATKVRGKWQFPGASRLDELNIKLKSLGMIRRTKDEVLPQLPPKRRSVIPVEMQDRKEYDLAERDLITWLASWDLRKAQIAAHAERRVKFGYLKRLAAKLKMKSVLDWIDASLSESDGKLLLGVLHKVTTQTLLEKYKDICVVIDGSKTAKQREWAEQQFQTNPRIRILIGQMEACGLGLNLTAANEVDIIELPWSHSVCLQFESRPHRLTTKHPINVRYFVADNSIEERLCQIIQTKQRNADMVLDGVKARPDSLKTMDLLQQALIRKVSSTTSSQGIYPLP